MLPCALHLQFKGETHVTLWHCEDPVLGPDAQLKASLVAAIGQEAVIEVTAIDHAQGEITAAVVQVRALGV